MGDDWQTPRCVFFYDADPRVGDRLCLVKENDGVGAPSVGEKKFDTSVFLIIDRNILSVFGSIHA